MKNKEQNNAWVGIKDKTNDVAYLAEANDEFVQLPIVETLGQEEVVELQSSRRDFLKLMGFGVGAATVAACETPVRRAIPYVTKPEEIVPGVANYYASSYVDGGDYCSILVKTREGRPIKIEGNAMSPVSKGGTSARVQASVLSLYDKSRFKGPIIKNQEQASWLDVDNLVEQKLSPSSTVAIVSRTILSPTTKSVIQSFQENLPNTSVVLYDPISSAAQLAANKEMYGERTLPDYHFDKADVIVSFNADFLGTWISPIEYSADYAKNRKIQDAHHPTMSWHVQVESGMSLTGSNADNRILVRPSEQASAIAYLLGALGGEGNGASLNAVASKALDTVAEKLKSNSGKSLVVSSSNNVESQRMINKINDLLGNTGATLTFENASLQRQGDERSLSKLIDQMNAGSVDALIVLDANPAYDNPLSEKFSEAVAKVELKISTSIRPDETASLCDIIAPTHHMLESWGDAEPKKVLVSLIQPTISPLFNSRKAEVSLLKWSGSEDVSLEDEQPYYAYLKSQWESSHFAGQNVFSDFNSFWDQSLQDGVSTSSASSPDIFSTDELGNLSNAIPSISDSGMELELTESITMGSGQHANNPWLMEMADPILRTTWGNYLSVPLSWEGGNSYKTFNNLQDGYHVDLTGKNEAKRIPVMTQFGQQPNTVSTAIGYGRMDVGAAGKNIGVNLFPWVEIDDNGFFKYHIKDVSVSDKKGEESVLACVQYHHSMGVTDINPDTGVLFNVDELTATAKTAGASPALAGGYQGSLVDRSIIRRANLEELSTEDEKDNFVHKLKHEREHHNKLNDQTLYPYEEYKEEFYSRGHHWGLYVDLNACTGCGACTVACMSENNVPVVGKREVGRHHEMSWLRIDRYYYGDVHNPNVVYQPMMCQHCDNAPCENVCPVAATNHSSEGLNQMTYNRCIGTRYCANNCPYKVRRFNWYDYTTADLFSANEPDVNGENYGEDNLTRMVLNPDVTVRTRGVIEKCSFCVQRIQEGKLTAKKERRALEDGDIKVACQSACPTGAIVFGDFNNEESVLAKNVKENGLVYRVLEEINVEPSVNYSAKIINRDHSLDA